MSGEYILEGRTPVPAKDMMEWAKWFEKADRVVRQTELKASNVRVSTVFLGLDHSFTGGPPLLFETLVFGGHLDGEMERYSARIRSTQAPNGRAACVPGAPVGRAAEVRLDGRRADPADAPDEALMAARKKKDPAALRTIDLFTGKTAFEEAEASLVAEAYEEEERDARANVPRDIVSESEECAVKWLGLDAFHEGDDIKVAVHPKGHAVLMLVNTRAPAGMPIAYGTVTHKLSRAQWSKLKKIVKEAP